MKERLYLIIILITYPSVLFCQGEFNNWYFGLGIPGAAGLSFNTGFPLPIPYGLSGEMPASMSDSAGSTLFLTDGLIVRNKNFQVMPNGCCLTSEGSDNNIPILATYNLNDDSSYYIFTAGGYNVFTFIPASYTIVNMRLDGGLGDIQPGFLNIPLSGGLHSWASITGSRHANNRDIWIVTTISYPDSIKYASYLVTIGGVSNNPVLSNSQGDTTVEPSPPLLPYKRPPHAIKISPDGKKLVAFYERKAEYCLFNPESGTVTRKFFISSSLPVLEWGLGEFSIDSKYLYVSFYSNDNYYILQFDADQTDSIQFMQSEYILDTVPNFLGLQLAPDWKIYGAMVFQDSLSVISNPSNQGIGCNFQYNALGLNGVTTWMLPQFIQRYKAYIHDSSNCQNIPVGFTSDIWPPPDSIHWDFGDPGSGSNNYSNADTAYHIYTNPGQYTITLFVRHIDNRTDTSWKTITIYPTPSVSLGPDRIICSGDSIVFDAGSCAGCSYMWRELISGDTVSLTQTYITGSSGIYSVEVTGQGNCKGIDTVQLQVTDPPVVITFPLSKSICSGDSTRIILIANVSGTTFSWTGTGSSVLVTGFSPGTGDTINQRLVSTSTVDETVIYWITPTAGNCAGDSVAYVVTVQPGDSVSVSIIASQNPVCASTSVTFTAAPTNGGIAPVYQWYINGISVGTNSAVFTYVPVNGDVLSCELLSSETVCVTNNPATSNTITMTVNPNNPVNVTISPSANPVCAGVTVTFTAFPQYGGSSPTYQWQVNGINAGTNSPALTYTPVNNDIVTCILTSSETVCVTNNPATSNTIIMSVNPNNPVSVSIIASQNPVCAGTSVTFTATPVNGGIAPVYQWYINGVLVGTNSPVFTYIPMTSDQVTCNLTSSETVCVTNNPATSNTITMNVNPNLPVSVSIAASQDTVCAGTSVTFTATPINGGTTPTYQWKVNGINTGTNSPVFTYVPASLDLVSCILLSSETVCVTNNPATSNVIIMTVNPNLPISVSIAASANPVCEGTSVTFTAVPVNEGTTPSYQWKVNGGNAGTNSPVFTYVPVNGETVSCELTSNVSCPLGNPALSNPIVMNVVAKPVTTFTACFDTITTVNAKPIKLKGGIPLGGTYSGPGVNTGIFYPAIAGNGTHVITYTYTNAGSCSSSDQISIVNYPLSIVNCGSPITDKRDNKVYPTIQIGSQCWLAANLNYGSPVPSAQYQMDNCIPEKYCYNDIPANCSAAGGLLTAYYQWDELMAYDASPGSQGLCPPAWHVPTEADWNTLFAVYINNAFAGSPLKYSGYSGFNALLTGARHFNKAWNYSGFAAFFWSSTPWGSDKAWAHGINDPDPSVSKYPSYRTNAFSVRCLKD